MRTANPATAATKAQTIPPLIDNPRYREITTSLAECANRERAALERIADIERRLATSAREDPTAVLRGERPADPEGLRREHSELRVEVTRLRTASRHLAGELDALVGTLGVQVAGPVLQEQLEIANEIRTTWRRLKALAEREATLLRALPDLGYGNVGQQSTLPANVDLDVVLREIDADVQRLAARASPDVLAGALPNGVKPDREGRIEARVLCDCRWGKADDVVRLSAPELNLAIGNREVDADPAAIAQARREQQAARERRAREKVEA